MENKKEVIASKRGFIVSVDGKAYDKKGNEVGYIDAIGYCVFTFRIEKKTFGIRIHRLQAYQKYGKALYEDGIMVRHFDGIKTNNTWDNILIGNMSENMMDIPEQIRVSRAKYASSFVTRKHDHVKIKQWYADNGESYKATMVEFNITSKGTLNYILKNNKKRV